MAELAQATAAPELEDELLLEVELLEDDELEVELLLEELVVEELLEDDEEVLPGSPLLPVPPPHPIIKPTINTFRLESLNRDKQSFIFMSPRE